MYPRTEYEMTEEDLQGLLQPQIPEMLIGGVSTSSFQQSNANSAWEKLGKKMGFDYMTVQPAQGKGQRFFTAVPSETEEARKERLEKQAIEQKKQNIARLENEIKALQDNLTQLLAS